MKILIFGDISAWNMDNFNIKKIDPKIISKIKNADYVLYNLEGPIKKDSKKYELQLRKNKIKDIFYKFLLKITKKEQPIVYSNKKILDLLKLNKNTMVTLANNHIKDLGYKGFKDTLDVLEKNNVSFVGAGKNNLKASRDLEIDNYVFINCNLVSSKKYGFYFKIYNATKNDYGASYQSYEKLNNKIKYYHNKNKRVILIIHGGKEMPKNNDEIGIDLEKIKSLNADISIIHHFHKYIKTEYERDNIFCIGDFIFNRPGKLPLNRESCFLEVEGKKNSLNKFKVGEV